MPIEWIYAAIVSLWLQEGALPSWAQDAVPIAIDIHNAAEAHPLPGPDGERRMAAVLLALSHLESRSRLSAIGDHGASRGPFQISRHWGCSDAPCAARLVLTSWSVCRSAPLAERLGWYASGGATCGRPASSRLRMALAGRLAASAPR